MWIAAILLAIGCVGIGYVSYVICKYKRLIPTGKNTESSRPTQTQTRQAIPDRRGMGAQSDFISETFVPSSVHRERQLKMAQTLIATGLDPELAAARMGIPVDQLSGK